MEHKISFSFCQCEPLALTLIRARLWPATVQNSLLLKGIIFFCHSGSDATEKHSQQILTLILMLRRCGFSIQNTSHLMPVSSIKDQVTAEI